MRRHDQEGLNVVILLPDSGSRYLSKVYNDNWMQENGFLQQPSSLGTLADLRKGRISRKLVTVSATATVPEVIGLLKLHGVSQLPVVDGDTLVGMISEKQLLERALQGERSNVDVGSLAQSDYCTITDDTDIAVLTDLFRRSKVAIVIENGKPADIITRIDLIDHISQLSAKRA
jgi:cystathionine beta-synthase